MNKDLIYIFDKLTFKRQELGEIQSNFNMSLTIDGTKDSTKVMVWSFNESEIEPNTICWHEKTNTWWIVAHDKIERYLNENETFIYVHNLQLEGAIELLNARDLTDCGFNQNTYTKGQFLNRLIKLSSFEFQGGVFRITADTNFLNQKVDYVKTFENYSLLSAIREFLDSYNKCAKLEFTQRPIGGIYTLHFANLVIINKTGDNTLTPHNMNEFDDVRETKTMNKNSFGTTVVSNAENVISSVAKTYPSAGSVKISSTENIIVDDNTINNGVIRLPSKVYKGNWLKMLYPLSVTLTISGTVSHNYTYKYARTDASFDQMFEHFADIISQDAGSQAPADIFMSYKSDTIKNAVDKASCVTFYDGIVVPNPNGSQIIKAENAPRLSYMFFNDAVQAYIFTNKENKECLPLKKQGIAWERGSNLITGFEILSGNGELRTVSTDYDGDYLLIEFSYNSVNYYLRIDASQIIKRIPSTTSLAKQINKLSFIINYVPMNDIKVKVDNSRTKRDMHLYNQNGKLTDNFALSKMLNSYSKEISSDTITKYKWYYSFNSVPKVGSMVFKPITEATNEIYVVNNVSLDFSQNEKDNNDFGYIIECEITMSKYVSTKSLMVNPNTNIRDYGIPQNFNVKRKQLYRDYYEIGYSLNSDTDDDYYIDPQRMFNIGRTPNENISLIAVIQCDYEEEINGYSNWYYQLETTTYNMNKMVYVVCDFNDNNIIGYASQNVYSGFVISRVFSGQTDTLNAPVSYVDANGEVKGIDIMFYEIEELTNIYNEYEEEHSDDEHYQDFKDSGATLYNYSTFIPQDIYLKARQQGNYALRITESTFVDANSKNYNKDAIEVPVFEYACQVDDSNEVLIGDNILTQHDNCIYFYHYIVGENLTQDNVIDTTHITEPTEQNPYRYKMEDSATINYVSVDYLKMLEINLYNYTQYDRDTNTWTDYVKNDIEANKDLAIFRHSYNLATGEELVELMFIAKDIPHSAIDQNDKTLILVLNHYKLN